jgi:hypothetical protein
LSNPGQDPAENCGRQVQQFFAVMPYPQILWIRVLVHPGMRCCKRRPVSDLAKPVKNVATFKFNTIQLFIGEHSQ